jgi:hypothetical protein
MTLKEKDIPRKEHIAKRNLDLLAQVALELFGNIQEIYNVLVFVRPDQSFESSMKQFFNINKKEQSFHNNFCCKTDERKISQQISWLLQNHPVNP